MNRNDGELPPHWVAADDQLRAGLRESQRQGRESQAAMWRRAGYCEADVQKKMDDHDARMSAMHEAMQSGVQGRSPNIAVPGPSQDESHPEPSGPAKEPRTSAPSRGDGDAEPLRPRSRSHPQGSVWETAEPVPGRASRWLTGHYRYGIGIVAGLVVALVAWIALQGAGHAFLGLTMWSWPTMLMAGLLPLLGLLWWVGEVHREVRHYIDFGGRVPVRFRRW